MFFFLQVTVKKKDFLLLLYERVITVAYFSKEKKECFGKDLLGLVFYKTYRPVTRANAVVIRVSYYNVREKPRYLLIVDTLPS